jgi:hypothetical protein
MEKSSDHISDACTGTGTRTGTKAYASCPASKNNTNASSKTIPSCPTSKADTNTNNTNNTNKNASARF